MALGGGNTPPNLIDTALDGPEHLRVVLTGTTRVANEVTYEGDFTAGADIEVHEAGIFNATPAGTMLSRWLTQEINLANGDQMNIKWTLTVG